MNSAICVHFSDLSIDDNVVIHDYGHNSHGAHGKVYWLDTETKIVSVTTKNCVDVWEGYADGLQKLIANPIADLPQEGTQHSIQEPAVCPL